MYRLHELVQSYFPFNAVSLWTEAFTVYHLIDHKQDNAVPGYPNWQQKAEKYRHKVHDPL